MVLTCQKIVTERKTINETGVRVKIALTGGKRKGNKAQLQGEKEPEKSSEIATEKAIETPNYLIQQAIQKRKAVQKERRKTLPEE